MRRYHHLDALRASAMLLGVAWHVAIAYGAHALPAQGLGDEYLAWIIATSHAFRLPVFFFLAGLFAAMIASRTTRSEFVRRRAVRLGVPLVVGLVTLSPLLRIGIAWRDGAPLLGDVWWHYFVPAHLWFLENLLVYCVLALGISALVSRPKAADRVVHVFLTSRLRVVSGVAAGTLLVVGAGGWTPHSAFLLFQGTAEFLVYGLFFAVGWVLWARREHLQALERAPLRHLGVAFVASLALTGMARSGWGTSAASPGQEAIYTALGLVIAWTALFGLIGLTARHCAAERASTRYLTDSVYWVYLVHFPLVAPAMRVAHELGLPWEVEALSVLVAVTGVSLVTYGAFVRYTVVGRVLHGPRERPVPVVSSSPAPA